jgi:RNA polymerase sigma-70 factor, ECF subfamily
VGYGARMAAGSGRNSLGLADTDRKMREPGDVELWLRAAQGDASAFGDLYDRHARSIYNYCFRRTADWALAEDLTSAVFLHAWRRRDVRLSGDSLLPWLYGVATNLIRNHDRGTRRGVAAMDRVDAAQAGPDFADDLAGRLDDERRMTDVLEAIRHLSTPDQEVLALCVWQGLGYAQAAAALDVPVGTIRSRLSRARHRLRELAAAPGHERDIDHESTGGTKGRYHNG